ncbi:MAG: YceI family protein [Saprospiraceae bacterium]|nr:YceI family protein [Saprospiraceae bacterium]
MKKVAFSLLAFSALFLSAFTTTPVDVAKVDVTKSEVIWTGKKVTGSHHGTIKLKEGSLMMEGGMLKGGSFAIDMTSIANVDLAGKDSQPKLEGHLKSADFFNVAEYPTADLDITSVVYRGTEGSYKVVADLTIKGITKPVKFNAQITSDNGMQVATADVVVDRSEYDVRYGSGSFFENLGDKTIYDEFTLNVKLVLQ